MVSANVVEIVISFITSFFWFKIFIQNVSGDKSSRKWSPEDAKNWPEMAGKNNDIEQSNDEQFTIKDRVTNVNSNDKENIPYTLIVMWGIFMINNESTNKALFYLSIIYLAARLLHTLFYLAGINEKPLVLRTASFMIGQLTGACLAITLPVGAIMNSAQSE